MRLGEGSHFDMVVIELQPTAEPHLPVGDVRNEAERMASSTRYLLASAGLDVPEDPSEPVRAILWFGLIGLVRSMSRDDTIDFEANIFPSNTPFCVICFLQLRVRFTPAKCRYRALVSQNCPTAFPRGSESIY